MKAMDSIRRVSDRHWFIAPLAAVIAAVLFWTVTTIRSVPVDIVRSDIITKDVKPGEFFVVRHHGEWHRRDCSGYERQNIFIDSIGDLYPRPLVVRGDLGRPSQIKIEEQTPFKITWGETQLVTRLGFYCFPFYELWPIRIERKPLRFHVSPP